MPHHDPLDDLFFALQGALAGQYSLIRELGRGGMGVVYLASEVSLEREVAIKVLPPNLARSPETRRQFVREAQVAARLSHPNIVPIYRVEETGDFVYIAMAYVPGVTLAQHIAAHGPLPPHKAIKVLREVAWALTHAHASGVVHRDVKADNVLLEAGTLRALVTDFGLANAADTRATPDTPAAIMGSAHYVSPEQISGEPADARSDIYSFGVAGYLTLTGRLPFTGRTPQEILARQLNDTPASVTTIAATTPAKLARIVERCMARSPRDRFQTAAEVTKALEGATELSREVPAPVRVWATREERMGGSARFSKLILLASGVLAVATAALSRHLMTAAQVAVIGAVGALLSVMHTRRVLKAGYGIDDLRAGMRDHWARRREEILYEFGAQRPVNHQRMLGAMAAGLVGFVAFGLNGSALSDAVRTGWLLASTALLGGGTVMALTEVVRHSVASQGKWHLNFWNSKAADRFLSVVGVGLRRRQRSGAISQRTEIALGRATDALFNALPKATRQHLRELPSIVRQLESDARALRDQIDQYDAAATVSVVGRGDTGIDRRESQLGSELAERREKANARLAATVAALETIRLDLLRLQLGTRQIESVTATLDAAREATAEISALADAHEFLDRELSPTR